LRAIDLGVGPHPRCKFGLVVTTGALRSLDQDELQTALPKARHELLHQRAPVALASGRVVDEKAAFHRAFSPQLSALSSGPGLLVDS